MENGKGVLKDKSYRFSLRSVNLYKHLTQTQKEFVLSKQLIRSGTSIGANIAEAGQAQSRSDFINKLSISLKEAFETEYWINLMRDTEYLTVEQAASMLEDCKEPQRLLTTSIKTAKLRKMK